jgi:hypothetical protein
MRSASVLFKALSAPRALAFTNWLGREVASAAAVGVGVLGLAVGSSASAAWFSACRRM